MRKILILLGCLFLGACDHPAKGTIIIGIIEPLEHKAMDEIVAGFSDTLHRDTSKPVVIKVENAQNDPNLQRAIIQKLLDANVDYILPIGAAPTQMALAMARGRKVISLASDLSQNDRNKLQPCNAAVVHDEISPQQLIEFIHAVYPTLKNLTLIHSSADKVFPDVKTVISASQKYGITVKAMMVSSLPELYSASLALPAQTEAIFILKDSLIVSGIGSLTKAAQTRHIPLITSDQGSVQEGAGFALGVHEREIGVQGAKLVAATLAGKSLCELPIVEMKKLTVFINPTALQAEAQNTTALETAANASGYQIESVSQKP